LKKLQFALVIAALSFILIVPAFGAPKFVLPHRYTWDSDVINVESVFAQGYTGAGVYIAVLDTGLVPNWRDYFPVDRIATQLGKGFWEPVHVDPKTGELVYAGFVVETSWVGSTLSSHGTHVISTIIGYNYYAPSDAAAGYPLPPLFIEGIAPGATVIPVKVLHTYNLPPYTGPEGLVFGTDLAVAAGIYYATELKMEGYSPMVISMSLGGPEPSPVLEDAIDYAIANGVVVVAAAGNDGLEGMDWPGAYPQMISAGANGWRYEWYRPTMGPHYRLWWLQDNTYGYRDILEPIPATDVYVTDWSGRENDSRVSGYDQELDVLAPGSWVRGPYPGGPAYNHLPWKELDCGASKPCQLLLCGRNKHVDASRFSRCSSDVTEKPNTKPSNYRKHNEVNSVAYPTVHIYGSLGPHTYVSLLGMGYYIMGRTGSHRFRADTSRRCSCRSSITAIEQTEILEPPLFPFLWIQPGEEMKRHICLGLE